ncbi:hypothetical protein ACGFZH_20430 [Streptomyces zaomyceticus]|uniref:hypothetical protein n=1 Tax=Streptomyces TaxID=1883 RepID=UPI0037136615
MKKIISVAALALTSLGLAAPAHADKEGNLGPGATPPRIWNVSAAAVCFQELGVVPVDGAWNGNTASHCADGNVLNHGNG